MTRQEIEFNGATYSIETGLMARQSDGAVVVRYGDTILLATVVAEKRVKEGLDFFPLTIDYQEKTYSAGKIPGGFFKREGRPSEKEVLTSRLIDRPIRPLFPKGYRSETQGIVSVISMGEENVSDVMGITGVSAALMVSDIPFDGPVAAVRVGRIGDEFIVNPDLNQMDDLDLNLIVAGTDDAVAMVEGGALELAEEEVLEAIDVAHREIKRLTELQRLLAEKVGREKRVVTIPEEDKELRERLEGIVLERMKEAIKIADKLKRQEALDIILEDAVNQLNTDPEKDRTKEITGIYNNVEKELIRGMIVNEGVRADGRGPADIRQISIETSMLPRVHGSALFVRGETQALAATTLGTSDDEQKIDALEGEYFKNFMLHYNFLPFSVGEVRFLRSPGRREIGHGALAERALRPVLPDKEEFPYTIRVVSDILESNGSSSMATVCGASLSMMDAGVPISSAVAGVAMGLIVEGDKTIVLTDILGLEDHLGDMDFKVAGTKKGITAFQMDAKIGGIDRSVMVEALDQARKGRIHIIEKMDEALREPRGQLSPYAPRIYSLKIRQDKIRDVIGSGGKVIRGIIEETGVKIDVHDDGSINIFSMDEASAQAALKRIEDIVQEPEVGKVYHGVVKRIVDFGAFVEIIPGTDGLLHISQIAHHRVEKVEDVLAVGDELDVKVIEVDPSGKVRLSRKELLERDPNAPAEEPRPGGGGDRGGQRRPRREGDRSGGGGGGERRHPRDRDRDRDRGGRRGGGGGGGGGERR